MIRLLVDVFPLRTCFLYLILQSCNFLAIQKAENKENRREMFISELSDF